MPIQMLSQLTPAEMSIPVMLKQMKEFDEHTKKKYGYSMSIPTDKYKFPLQRQQLGGHLFHQRMPYQQCHNGY